tara:strand:+ start:456 stop:1313 length:858 start_codon:yes stop_codon:yes gene_type:complete
MLTNLKKIIKKSVIIITRSLSRTRLGKLIGESMIEDVMHRVQAVTHNNIKMKFTTPNQLNHFRVDTFSSKEPETLEWIDFIPDNSILWDIGANIGLYSVYAARASKCKVFAFEPSVFNLELLARNIFINNLQEKITIIPLALTDKMGINKMRLTTTDWGGALSTFGKNIGWDGLPQEDNFSFQTFGCSMDQAVSIFKLPRPDFIKMDVDGIEHFILQGGKNILNKINGILIEINDDFKEQAVSSKKFLEEAGLSFKGKRHSEMIDKSATFRMVYNQIWVRESYVQ